MEFLVIWLLCGVVAAVAASNKGRSGCGWFLLGVLLGPFGMILALVVGDRRSPEQGGPIGPMRRCPHCAELIQPAARVCRHCDRQVDPVA